LLTKQTLDLAEGLPDLPVAFLAVKIDPHRNRRRHGLKVVGQFSKKGGAKKLKETELRVCLLSASLHAISLLVLYLSGGSTHNAFQPSRSSSHGFWERFVGNKKKSVSQISPSSIIGAEKPEMGAQIS
jgi:hypothetical protein